MRQHFWTKRRIVGLIAAGITVGIGLSRPVQNMAALPDAVMVPQGQKVVLPWSSWLSLSSASVGPVNISGNVAQVRGMTPGRFLLQTKLFGWLPWRQVPVEVTKPIYEVPGGESMGVLVNTEGLVVTQYAPVWSHGRFEDPAEQAGIDKGDVIVQVNHRPVYSDRALAQAVQQAGRRHQAVMLGVQGSRSFHLRSVRALWSSQHHRWQIGILVQDGASGVGTLTFYNPHSLQYAALGHSITDGLTRSPVEVHSGRVTGADIVGIIAGTANAPGQKIGVLTGGQDIQGNVRHNGIFGITGTLWHRPYGPAKPLPVALPDQVTPGPAHIITVLHGQRTHAYAVRILKTYPQWAPHTKGLLFEVDDPRLLSQTGGVIQGMSGSPIIQNGRIVGAVTHVLVSRPSLGYGCYAYWMVKQKSLT
ncbi:SpoIVB peptidase [Sulfobacillus sp. hq2]|uniref:SpoIVB peptidase n=1 Tax=Sulfobacillus TaxID=28033 RepID=UPI001FA93393|nr:SpoIVB peptidase [Sulfobacillus sp. hq2]MCY0907887.1 SpoIVB peptidase [Sulfobacillus thermotolerans]